MATNFFGIGYHLKILRSQMATEKKVCPAQLQQKETSFNY